jgi:hypothetical protein
MTRYRDDDEYGDWLYHKLKDDELDMLGVIARPATPQPKKPTDRPDGDPSTWRGVWYADGDIPH